MCFPTFTALGSTFLLFSFILELFILIGQLSNRVFLTDLFFGSAWNTSQNTRYNFALWNYCSGDMSGTISSCAHPTPAFNWATTPGLSSMLQSQANSGLVHNLFMAMFVLFFIACGWSFLLWLVSIPICCFKSRVFGFSMSALVFINFIVMLVALILALVLVLSGVKQISANAGWNAQAGNLLWITIGAVISLLISTAFYSCGSAGGRGKKRKVDPEKDYYNNTFLPYGQPAYDTQTGYNQGVQDQTAYNQGVQDQTAYNQGGQDQTAYNQGAQGQTAYNQGEYNQADYNQGYNQPDNTMPSANMGQHDMNHSDAVQQTPNDQPVSHGYQTPTLDHSNLPH